MEKDTSITSEIMHSEVTRPKLSVSKETLRQLKVRTGLKAGLEAAMTNSVYCTTPRPCNVLMDSGGRTTRAVLLIGSPRGTR